MAQRTVTWQLLKPNGDAWEGAQLEFALLPGGYESGGTQYPGYTVVSAGADANGDDSVSLWRNEAGVESTRYRVTMPDRSSFDITVPDSAASVLLSTLRATGASTWDPDATFSSITVTGVATFQSHVVLGDDDELRFGAGTDYWFSYDSANTRFRLRSTDVDGAGTDGDILRIEDGTDTVDFVGAVTLGGALTLGGDLTRAADQTIDLTGAATRTLTLQNSTASQVANMDVDGVYIWRNGHATGTFTFAGTPTAARTLTWPDSSITVNAAADISGTTLASNVVTSSLTTIGTLVAGAVPANLVTAATFAAGTYSFAGSTISDLGTVTTVDINGGTINGTVIGGSSAAAITGTTIFASTSLAAGAASDGSQLYLNTAGGPVARWVRNDANDYRFDITTNGSDMRFVAQDSGGFIFVPKTTGTVTFAPTVSMFSVLVAVDDTTQATSTTAASLQTDGGFACVKDAIIGGSIDAAFPNTVAGTGLMVTTNDTSVQEIMRDSSSLTLKDDVAEISLMDARAFLNVPAISYRMKRGGMRDWGFGAEHVHDAGLHDVIAYEDDAPMGFKSFGRGLVAAHHVLIQDHESRAQQLESTLREILTLNPHIEGGENARRLLEA